TGLKGVGVRGTGGGGGGCGGEGGSAATHGGRQTGRSAVGHIKVLADDRPAEDVVGEAVAVHIAVGEQVGVAHGQAIADGGGVRGGVEHEAAGAGGHGGDRVGGAPGESVSGGGVVLGRDPLDGHGHRVAAVGGVGEGYLHLVGIGLIEIVA